MLTTFMQNKHLCFFFIVVYLSSSYDLPPLVLNNLVENERTIAKCLNYG